MTKRYILSQEDLQNLMHESIMFFSKKAQEMIAKSQNIMFSDRVRWINEFLETCLKEFPIDKLLDEVEKDFTSFNGRTIDEIKNELRAKQPSYDDQLDKVKKHLKLLEDSK